MKMCQSLDEVNRLIEPFDGSAGFVINHSGGKDSTRMLGFVREGLPEATTFAVITDIGIEHQRPISAAEIARAFK
jgi:3'-phosphoadenosine 5'-phosphosulfate sulfotransferase (PAPS reductase)/FAD synthetase